MIYTVLDKDRLIDSSALVFLNGLLQSIEDDYTIINETILFKFEISIADKVIIKNDTSITKYCNEKNYLKTKINKFKEYYKDA